MQHIPKNHITALRKMSGLSCSVAFRIHSIQVQRFECWFFFAR